MPLPGKNQSRTPKTRMRTSAMPSAPYERKSWWLLGLALPAVALTVCLTAWGSR